MRKNILFLDDNRPTKVLWKANLERWGLPVVAISGANTAAEVVARYVPDLILVGCSPSVPITLHFIHSLRVCCPVQPIPVIAMLMRWNEDDCCALLDAGADDCVTSSISPRELVARIKNLLRTTLTAHKTTIAAGALQLDNAAYRVTASGHPIKIGVTEFRLLRFLMTNPGQIYSRNQLLEYVWQGKPGMRRRTVDVYIRYLRKSLAAYECNHLIQTVRGVGYRFAAQN